MDSNELNLLLGILGLVAGIVSVLVTVRLYYKVKNIESKRRTEQKEHFKKLVINNVEDALTIYNSVTILAHREKFTPEETDDKTIGLQNLFSKKHEEIQNLVRDTKFYASMLSVIDTPSIDMKEVIEKIAWLTKDFYILENSIERNKNHWVSLETELRENKDFIETSLSSLNTL